MSISPARAAAFDILLRIETERAFSSVLLPEFEEKLHVRDRGLCHEITLGVLRKQLFLDAAIDKFSGGKRLDAAVRIALRIGIYQILFLARIPAHSAVNESVSLVGRAKKSSARGFVNAVLRRLLREGFVPELPDGLDGYSIETSHPKWLLERWTAQFGLEAAVSIARSNNTRPPMAFRRTRKVSPTVNFEGTAPSKNVPGCFFAGSLTSALADAAANGEIYFQDEGSQLIGAAVDVPAAGRFLDVCAAPGSKVTQLAALFEASFVAGDLHAHRARFLSENARKQGTSNISVVQYDAEAPLPFADAAFDGVLVDAPCTGTGTIRHNPEIRYFLDPGDPAELSRKQRRILANASKMVKAGGVLYYSTCSLEKEENEAVVDYFLTTAPGFRKVPPSVQERFLTPEEYARTWPAEDDMDGFFLASFVNAGFQ